MHVCFISKYLSDIVSPFFSSVDSLHIFSLILYNNDEIQMLHSQSTFTRKNIYKKDSLPETPWGKNLEKENALTGPWQDHILLRSHFCLWPWNASFTTDQIYPADANAVCKWEKKKCPIIVTIIFYHIMEPAWMKKWKLEVILKIRKSDIIWKIPSYRLTTRKYTPRHKQSTSAHFYLQ